MDLLKQLEQLVASKTQASSLGSDRTVIKEPLLQVIKFEVGQLTRDFYPKAFPQVVFHLREVSVIEAKA